MKKCLRLGGAWGGLRRSTLAVVGTGTCVFIGIIGKGAAVAAAIAIISPLICLALIGLAGLVIGSALASGWHTLNPSADHSRLYGAMAELKPRLTDRKGTAKSVQSRIDADAIGGREIRLVRRAHLGQSDRTIAHQIRGFTGAGLAKAGCA